MIADERGHLDETIDTDPDNIYGPWPAQSSATADDESPAAVVAKARSYIAAGLSVIPIGTDGTKSPDWRRLPKHWDCRERRHKRSWKTYQVWQPREDELEHWAARPEAFGLGAVGGMVSGREPGVGLEIIDVDTVELAEPWIKAVEGQAAGLISRLVRVQTPRPGLHVYYRCAEIEESQKLACEVHCGPDGRPLLTDKGKLRKKTLIETKGVGGYCVLPGSPGACHPTGRHYELVDDSPTFVDIPIITPQERQLLLACARQFNTWIEPAEPKRVKKATTATEDRPGDDFNERGDWDEILCPHGWKVESRSGDVTNWRRPGKSSGSSATTGYCKSENDQDLLHVFSTNSDPFEDGKTYCKFAAYALLEHDGDYVAAARALASAGYGKQSVAVVGGKIVAGVRREIIIHQ